MSKMMENKQMIHIASEIIVLGGLIYYFNQKNKKLLSHIQDLSRKIEDQEGILQNHEEIIRKMSEFITQQKNTIEKSKKIPVKEIRTITPKKSEPIKVSFKKNPSPIKNKIVKRVEEISSSEEEEEEEESDLDAELEEELQELEIQELEIEKLSLKKKN